MSTRRNSREWAVQLLFQLDLNHTTNIDEALSEFWRNNDATRESKIFAKKLIDGVLKYKEVIDDMIAKASDNWDIQRMMTIDRNVIRLAIYEMYYLDEIPPLVTINEAIDIAKYFSSDESGRFVNGILDKLHKDLNSFQKK